MSFVLIYDVIADQAFSLSPWLLYILSTVATTFNAYILNKI